MDKLIINTVSVLLGICLICYFIFNIRERNKFMNDKNNIKYTIGKITNLEFGAKVPSWFVYEFYIDSTLYKGEKTAFKIKNTDIYLNKYYIIEYNTIKPIHNKLLLNTKITDSLLMSKNHIWSNIPKEVLIPYWTPQMPRE